MMIIVLGEAVDDLVPRLGEDDANLVLYVTTACLFLSVVCVKLLYFDSDTDSLENHAILNSPFSAFLWNNLHIPMSAGLVLLSSGMAEILECAVHEEESLSRGQRFVFLGLGLSLGALGLARTMHHRDWDELDKAVKADLDLGKWFQKKNKKVTDRAGLLNLLKQIFVAQQTFMLVSAVVYGVAAYAVVGHKKKALVSDLTVSIVLFVTLALQVVANLFDEVVEFRMSSGMKRAVEDAFDEVDEDNSGTISFREFSKMMDELGARDKAPQIYVLVDEHRAGLITKKQFEKWFLSGMQGVSRKIESRTYAVGDEVKVIKKGSQTGKHGIILDPDWTGRCKVRMLDKKPDDKKAIKSYVVFEREAREFQSYFYLSFSRKYHSFIPQENHSNNVQMYTRILRKLNSRFALEHRYAPYDLEMVMPHLATNDFQIGDRVKVIKFGSSKAGRIVTVVNPLERRIWWDTGR